MALLDAQAGLARMRSFGSYESGACLEAVWVAYGAVPSIGPHAGDYGWALKGWEYAEFKHPERDVPAGAPVYFSPGGNGYGHVAISAGGNRIVSTDIPYAGGVGETTIEAIEARWGRTYLGWTEDFLGHTLVNFGGGGSGGDGPAGSSTLWVQQRLNAWAAADGVPTIAEDGVRGPETDGRIRSFQDGRGIEVDGIVGPITTQHLAANPPGTGIAEDGILGPETIGALQQVLADKGYYAGPVDGLIDEPFSNTVAALQRYLNDRDGAGLVVDGSGLYQNGTRYATVAAVQRHVGGTADGVFDVPQSNGVLLMQRALNAGGF